MTAPLTNEELAYYRTEIERDGGRVFSEKEAIAALLATIDAQREAMSPAEGQDLLPGDVPEAFARFVFQAAMTERRCAELYVCLSNGGAATIDRDRQRLVLVSGEQLSAAPPAEELTSCGSS
ncbi:MAG: hypothetical protein JWM85_3497 [Acidimicrobiaceae bacterium]|nr:hypothetical protein [Acidimicrobiaceae bacterium]